MDWQTLITALLVAGCSAYAAWQLMPRGWRLRLATRLGRPEAAATEGCGGCDGCADAAPKPGRNAVGGDRPAVSVIHIVRKPRAP